MDPQPQQLVSLLLGRLEQYQRGGPASLVLDAKVDDALALVATAWNDVDTANVNRKMPTQAWHTLATLHAHRSLLVREPGRSESRALAVHYFRRAGVEGAPARELRERLARVTQDDWLEQIGDGRDRGRLLASVRGRVQRAMTSTAPLTLLEPQVGALALALMEAALWESPGADTDPPEPDEDVWAVLGWLHEGRGYSEHSERVLDQNLADYYFLQISAGPRGIVPDSVLEAVNENPHLLSSAHGYRIAQVLLGQHERTKNLEALYAALHLLRRAAAVPPTGTEIEELCLRLGGAWLSRFKRSGQADHLDRAIEHAREVYRIDASNPLVHDRAGRLLCFALKTRFQRETSSADVDEAIGIARSMATVSSDPGVQMMLADLLLAGNEHIGYEQALAEAETVLRAALADLPDDHPLRPGLLNELGSALGMRHTLNNDTEALDEAIEVFGQAQDLVSADDPRWEMYFKNKTRALTAKIGEGEMVLAAALVNFEQATLLVKAVDGVLGTHWLPAQVDRRGCRAVRITVSLDDLGVSGTAPDTTAHACHD